MRGHVRRAEERGIRMGAGGDPHIDSKRLAAEDRDYVCKSRGVWSVMR
jgi:hypothetical protein